MADWVGLADAFRYDAWANLLWLETLSRKGAAEPDRAILAHILAAGNIWLLRCQGESPTSFPTVPLTVEAVENIGASWVSLLETAEEDRTVSYRRTTGEAFTLPLSGIAKQVTNHGTYHRGELRGLCRLRGDEDFPETDWMRFLMSR